MRGYTELSVTKGYRLPEQESDMDAIKNLDRHQTGIVLAMLTYHYATGVGLDDIVHACVAMLSAAHRWTPKQRRKYLSRVAGADFDEKKLGSLRELLAQVEAEAAQVQREGAPLQ